MMAGSPGDRAGIWLGGGCRIGRATRAAGPGWALLAAGCLWAPGMHVGSGETCPPQAALKAPAPVTRDEYPPAGIVVVRPDPGAWRSGPGAAARPELPGPRTQTLVDEPWGAGVVLLTELPPGTRVPAHWHSANQFHVVVHGRYAMRAEAGQEVELPPGGFNFVPAGVVHEGRTVGDSPALLVVGYDGPVDQKVPGRDGEPPTRNRSGDDEAFVCIRPHLSKWEPIEFADGALVALAYERPRGQGTFAYVRLPGGGAMPWHTHSAASLMHVLSGRVWISGRGLREEACLDAGMLARVPAETECAYRADTDGALVLVWTRGVWNLWPVPGPADVPRHRPDDREPSP